MSDRLCISCRSPKISNDCGICGEPVCKSCDVFVRNDTFTFLAKIPEELSKTHYCPTCHGEKVEPALERYNETMAQAREAFIFFTTQKKRIPIIKKAKEPIHATGGTDRDETILRLAFQAAELGHNAVVETEVSSKKVRNQGYQTSDWQGRGVPATIDVAKLERQQDD